MPIFYETKRQGVSTRLEKPVPLPQRQHQVHEDDVAQGDGGLDEEGGGHVGGHPGPAGGQHRHQAAAVELTGQHPYLDVFCHLGQSFRW